MTAAKSLQPESEYNKYDINKDGIVSDRELERSEKIIEAENKDAKEDQLRKMAWVAMGSMVIFTGLLFTPIIPDDRISALDNLLQMFYIAQAGVVATFFGASAYVSR
ncbi:hypothetical protein UFOVP247_198 [uncultured Caudovirales phage]|uniref:EF-hand domain-containing protein n=1 Tax=uncultured Caudovirales phage TaxID=2100421 RepID=A0A6J7WZT5_9CAUD|nr:hypothetical protein UFOVP247_198 [uncultured Caudovirales phage]